jgi:phosphoglycolate phosphatase-like HAD superfamily hydrolase
LNISLFAIGHSATSSMAPCLNHFCSKAGARILLPLIFALFLVICIPRVRAESDTSDPLPSWNDGPNKQSILDFIHDTTTADSPDFVKPAERIAVFDQDGTLWVEKPIYTEAVFCADRLKELAHEHSIPNWKDPLMSMLSGNKVEMEELAIQNLQTLIDKLSAEKQEKGPSPNYTPHNNKTGAYEAITSGDKGQMEKLAIEDFETAVAIAHSGMTTEKFKEVAEQWLAGARHSRFKKPYTQLVYQPMLEVMDLFRAHGYKNYIVTGGGQEFVRTFAEKIYGVPPECVIGTAGETKYTYAPDGKSELVKQPKMLLIDDRDGKPKAINLIVGRRPYAAFGNSTGDKEMLEWTQSGEGKRLMMLVHHDDAEREYSYGPESKVGTFSEALMSESHKRNWNVISIKRDWKVVFPQ